jgi:hypothetical protein
MPVYSAYCQQAGTCYNISQCGAFHVMVQVYIFYLDTKKLYFPLQMVAESILCFFHKGYIFTEWLLILSFATATSRHELHRNFCVSVWGQ